LSDYRIVLVTTPSSKEAKKIATSLLEQRLCACVNILPKVSSYFRWQGKIEKAKECLLIIKTKKKLFKDLCAQIKTLHSYSVPEVISLSVEEGSVSYLDWIDTALDCQKVKHKRRPRTK
jgi:periplasmic divalent cation tolerance protein